MSRRVLLLTEEQGHGGVHTLLVLLRESLSQQGWQVDTVNVRQGRPGLFKMLSQARQAQVLVASNNFSPAYWAVLLGLLVQRPSIVWVHGPLARVLAQQPVSWLKKWLLHLTSRMADGLVFTSHTSQQSFHEVIPANLLPQQNIIHNPAPDFVDHSPAPPVAGVALGFVGRLSSEKRPGLLLQMLQHLPEDHHLTLVGDGPLLTQLQQQARDLGLLGQHDRLAKVCFAGPQTVGVQTYRQWQATLLCSAYEGYPMVALESLAAGVPCLGTSMPALQEMLGPWASAWLAATDEPYELAQTVLKALQTPAAKRRQQALSLAKQHPLQSFSRQWNDQLLRCLRHARPQSVKTVHFVHAGPAYMPELAAYEEHLQRLGHGSQRHSHAGTVPVDADIVWWICGRVSVHHSHRLRRSLHVHEYASASVGRWPALKDRLKRWWHPKPDHRVFLNAWVQQRIGFVDSVPYTLRDMGVPASFVQAQADGLPEYDLVYLGEMGRLRSFLPALKAISQAGLRLLLIGQLPLDLSRVLELTPGVHCTGRIPHAQVPMQLLRARAGLNLVPDRLPLTMQTSTKVLEYMAVGLPVLSNDYPWARLTASRYPERIGLLTDLHLPERWAQAMTQIPPRTDDREDLKDLLWSERLSRMTLWQALGLTEVRP